MLGEMGISVVACSSTFALLVACQTDQASTCYYYYVKQLGESSILYCDHCTKFFFNLNFSRPLLQVAKPEEVAPELRDKKTNDHLVYFFGDGN